MDSNDNDSVSNDKFSEGLDLVSELFILVINWFMFEDCTSFYLFLVEFDLEYFLVVRWS